MIEFVELRYENDLLERHYGESLELMNDLSVPTGKQSVLTTLLGKGLTSNLSAYYIRMPFRLNLPLCALKKAPVFRVKFRPSQEFSTLNWTLPIKVSLFVDYVYITKAERDYFKTAKIDYLTHTIQRLQFTVDAITTKSTFVTEFTRPVKELYWVIQTDGAAAYDYTNAGAEQLVSLRLQFNGVDVILPEIGTPLFLRTIQGLENHTRVPDRAFYMYPFALDPEHPTQPTGSVNMSALTRQMHTLELSECSFSRHVRVYAVTHNVVRIANGAAKSLFDSVQEGGTMTGAKELIGNLYSFTTFTFTPAGATGSSGPTTLAAYGTGYPGYGTGYPLTLSGGIQYWYVPDDATYTFTVAGAGSFHTTSSNPIKVGYGVVMNASYSLAKGQLVAILVGQQGLYNADAGGGTFVASVTGVGVLSTAVPLFVAGGAGGPGGQSGGSNDNINGTFSTTGRNGQFSAPINGGSGGVGPAGGKAPTSDPQSWADGGAGFSGNGEWCRRGSSSNVPKSFVNGGTGGTNGAGGFGGGAGFGGYSNREGGGGGGYGGGGSGGSVSTGAGGGGGGSYDITGTYSGTATNVGPGYVTVTKV
jgi:hypothetical protein